MAEDLKLIVTQGEPDPEDKKALYEGMLAYHKSKGHPRKKELFSIFLKSQSGKVLGGVIVSFEWNGMQIQTLWVDDSIRNQGWGSKLMQLVEEEAIKRGCTLAFTDTFTWQAPEFYLKLGYTLYGELENLPEGNSLSYYYKKL